MGDAPSKALLFDCGTMFSGTFDLQYYDPEESEDYPKLWALSVRYGAIMVFSGAIPVTELFQRCVYDETLEYVTAPYDDPETGLLWSEISSDYLSYEESENHCAALSEEDPEHHWRIPTIEELRTLVRNCGEDDAPCPLDIDGRYSVFRDTDILWASGEEEVWNPDFMAAQAYAVSTEDYVGSKVRCVSGGEEPAVEGVE